jgi:predicted AlkP superfamily pyrophosphatase or phosphodiesterase
MTGSLAEAGEEGKETMVVLIMIDGLRPDAITPERCPALAGVMARGAYSLRAASVMPCLTLPCHMSIFHSVPPGRHGVTSNLWSPMARPLPGLVEVAHAAGRRCAFFYNWEPLRNLSQPGSLAHAYFRDSVYSAGGDHYIAGEAMRALPVDQPDFAFVYLGTVDVAGHASGWMSPAYLAQATRVDEALDALLAVLPADTHVLIQADHGGHDRSHGSDIPEDMLIPWMLAGPGVSAGHALDSPVSLLDTAPTVARLLGVAPHSEWEGHVLVEAFT